TRVLEPRHRAQPRPPARARQPRHAERRRLNAADEAGFAGLARLISDGVGIGLESYKDRCLRRRIAVRMRACGVHTYEDYAEHLAHTPEEFERLRDALTINVTR